MSRDDGFAIMDISTSVLDDPRFRKLARFAPDHVGAAVTGYVATLASSWKDGRRVSVDDAWPALLPFDSLAVDALKHVRLLDSTGRIPVKPWRGWFEAARARRDKQRADWREWQRTHRRGQGQSPTPSHAGVSPDSVQDKSIPSAPTVPSVPTEGSTRPLTFREAVPRPGQNGLVDPMRKTA